MSGMAMFHQLDLTAIIAWCDECSGGRWLQILIFVPHGILGFTVAFWLWWPKLDEGLEKVQIKQVSAGLLPRECASYSSVGKRPRINECNGDVFHQLAIESVKYCHIRRITVSLLVAHIVRSNSLCPSFLFTSAGQRVTPSDIDSANYPPISDIPPAPLTVAEKAALVLNLPALILVFPLCWHSLAAAICRCSSHLLWHSFPRLVRHWEVG